MRGKVRNFFAEFRTAMIGVALAFRRPKYIFTVIIAFIIFGTLMSLLSGGTAGVSLMFAGGPAAFINVLSKAFLGLFGYGRAFTDWAVVFFVSVLQAIVIGLVALVWKKRKASQKSTKSAKSDNADNADNVEKAGIAAGLAVLGTGCPTCGTTLLAPVITAIVGGSGMALASAISGLLTVAAILVLLFSLRSLGLEAYTLLVLEDILKHKERKNDRKSN